MRTVPPRGFRFVPALICALALPLFPPGLADEAVPDEQEADEPRPPELKIQAHVEIAPAGEPPFTIPLETLPLWRSLGRLDDIVPGVVPGGGGDRINDGYSGASAFQAGYRIEGIDLTEAGYGAAGTYSLVYGALGPGTTYDFLDRVTVETSGLDASVGEALGGRYAATLRQGTERFSFDAAWYEQPAALEGDRGARLNTPNHANMVDSLRRELSLAVGGPIVSGRLFGFAAFNPVRIEQDFRLTSGEAATLYDLDGDGNATDAFAPGTTIEGGRTPGSVTRKRSIDNYAARLTGFLTADHKLDLLVFGDPSDGDLGPQDPTTYLRRLADPARYPDPMSGARRLDWGSDHIGLRYQGVFGTRFLTEIRLSRSDGEFRESGAARGFSIFDSSQGIQLTPPIRFERTSERTDRFEFRNTHLIGPVSLSYGARREKIEWSDSLFAPVGDGYTAYFPNLATDGAGSTGLVPACSDASFSVGGVPVDADCYTPVVSRSGADVSFDGSAYRVTKSILSPLDQPTTAEDDALWVETTWAVSPFWTLRMGLRRSALEQQGAGSFTLPIGYVSGVDVGGGRSTTLAADRYEFEAEWSPRFQATWDVSGAGRHYLFGGWSRYVQRLPQYVAQRAWSRSVEVGYESFSDAGLSLPNLDGLCGFDTDDDGLFDSQIACHQPSVFGLSDSGGRILDGSQADPASPLAQSLGPFADLVSDGPTRLPATDEALLGYAGSIGERDMLEARWIHRRLRRTIEDLQFASVEQFSNQFYGSSGGSSSAFGDPFPGHGVAPFGSYVLANPGGNVVPQLVPEPERDYDALELIYQRSFRDGLSLWALYRWARAEGNYEGFYVGDTGCPCPGIGSQFDFPAASAIDDNGDGVHDRFLTSDLMAAAYRSEPLDIDRRQALNLLVAKQFAGGFRLGGRIGYLGGRPRAPLYGHPAYRVGGEIAAADVLYWWPVDVDVDADGAADGIGFFVDADGTLPTAAGDTSTDHDGDGTLDTVVGGFRSGPRVYSYTPVGSDHAGRTASVLQLDVHVAYDWALRRDGSRLVIMVDVFNLLDDDEVVLADWLVENRTGLPNPDYRRASRFQEPRQVRLGIAYQW